MESLPKGPWTKNLEKFPAGFNNNSLDTYKKKIDTGKEKPHLHGYRMFKAQKVTRMVVHYTVEFIIVKANVAASMKKLFYSTHVKTSEAGDVIDGHCTCKSGRLGYCKHVFAILWQLLDYVVEEKMFIEDSVPCTSRPKAWGLGSELRAEIKPLEEFNFIKHDPRKPNKDVLTNFNKKKEKAEKFKTLNISDDLLRKHTVMLRQSGLIMFCRVIETNNFLPLHSLYNNTSNVSNSNNLDLPIAVKWSEEFSNVADKENIRNFQTLVNNCSLTLEQARKLEQDTKVQNNSMLWIMERQKRITSTKFGPIIKRKAAVNQNFLNQVWPKRNIQTSLMRLGTENESSSIEKYLMLHENYESFKCGFVVNPGVPFLGASPDRVILDTITQEYFLAEVKTLVKGGLLENNNVKDCIVKGLAPFLEIKNDVISLKNNHNYFFQIQGQLALTGLQRCDLVVDSGNDIFVEQINFVEEAWIEMCLPHLTKFYFNYFDIKNNM